MAVRMLTIAGGFERVGGSQTSSVILVRIFFQEGLQHYSLVAMCIVTLRILNGEVRRGHTHEHTIVIRTPIEYSHLHYVFQGGSRKCRKMAVRMLKIAGGFERDMHQEREYNVMYLLRVKLMYVYAK